ncbi:alpha/beta fold hydrolase [Shimia biformata]|uniref:alpha/beta fold hydrolase n=1 Tax=Shimia biformata TaxID=1294299 RepID=UPI001951463A|nr:alpha/beta hydrolase [Shimia biformata]
MRDLRFEINGNPFFAQCAGDPDAPLILCLHGFPEYSGAYQDVLPLLAKDHFVVAPDQRGYGQSWKPQGVAPYAIPNLAADAAAMIDLFGNGRAAAAVGHDWGASVAYYLAFRYPAKLAKLVIVNGVHPVPFQAALATGGAQSAASQYIPWLRREGSEARLAADNFAALTRLFAENMDMSWLTPDRHAAYAAAWGGEDGLRAMVNWYRATPLKVARPGEPIPPEDLSQIDPATVRVTMPHLLLWARDDTALLPESRAGLDAFCDDLTVTEIDGADHWVLHQKPEQVARGILKFLG